MYPVPQADGLDPSAALQLISQRAQMLTRSTGAAIALGHKESMICLASVGANAPTLGSRWFFWRVCPYRQSAALRQFGQ
jgi:hypothetical protein